MTRYLPIPRRREKPRKGREPDPAYLQFIRSLPCVCCVIMSALFSNHRQATVSEAAHVGARGLGQRCPDRETIPLCALHHTRGEHAHHRMQKEFWVFWDLDRIKLIEEFQTRYEAERRAA